MIPDPSFLNPKLSFTDAKCIIFTIEPMINMGSPDIEQKSDGWTIVTKDRAPSAHFEYTVAVKKGKTEVLSPFSIIENNLKQDHG